MSVISCVRTFICSKKKQVAARGFQHYHFVGVGDVQARFEELWSGMGDGIY